MWNIINLRCGQKRNDFCVEDFGLLWWKIYFENVLWWSGCACQDTFIIQIQTHSIKPRLLDNIKITKWKLQQMEWMNEELVKSYNWILSWNTMLLFCHVLVFIHVWKFFIILPAMSTIQFVIIFVMRNTNYRAEYTCPTLQSIGWIEVLLINVTPSLSGLRLEIM